MGSEPPEVEPTRHVPAGSRRRRTLIAMLMVACAVVAYIWWPRSAPSYVVLPADHGKVTVKSWISSITSDDWGWHRRYYIRTEAPHSLGQVLDDLTQRLSDRAQQLQRPSSRDAAGSDSPEEIPGRRVSEVRGFKVVYIDDYAKASSVDPRLARSVLSDALPLMPEGGGYGRPIPQSFATFGLKGPEHGTVSGTLSHHIKYRLHEIGPNRTVVEIWDLRRSHP